MADIHETQRHLREIILRTAYETKEGHVPSSLSVVDIILALYTSVMQPRDLFILSKGHAALALYAVLFIQDIITVEDLASFGKRGSILGGHPDRLKVPGVVASTGSLGHGLPQAVGLALADRTRNVYVVSSDGELNEGSCWESIALAHRFRLGNLCCIVDSNDSTHNGLDMGDLGAKFIAFDWSVFDVNGHDHDQIVRGCYHDTVDHPLVVIAHTTKGYGVPEMEADPMAWHRKPPTREMLERFVEVGEK